MRYIRLDQRKWHDGRPDQDSRDPHQRHDLRELRGAQREGAAPARRRQRGQRQFRHREGSGDVRPGADRRRPADRHDRAGRLRRAHSDRHARHRRHDLRELRRACREGAAAGAGRAQGDCQSGHRTSHRRVPAGHDRPRRPGGGGAAGRLRSGRSGPRPGRRIRWRRRQHTRPDGRRELGRRDPGRRRRRPRGLRPARRLPAPAAQGRDRRRPVGAHLPGQHGLRLRARLSDQRLGALGAGHTGAVLGRTAVLPGRLRGGAPRRHHYGHPRRHGVVGRLLL